MKIETIRVKNCKAFGALELTELPELAACVGANGSGKIAVKTVVDRCIELLWAQKVG